MDDKENTLNIIVGGMFDPMTKRTVDELARLDFVDKTNLYGNPRQIFKDINTYDRGSVHFGGRLGLSFFTNTGPTGASFVKNNIVNYLKDCGYFIILSETIKKAENMAMTSSQIASEIFIHIDEDKKRFIIYGKVRENPFSPNANGKLMMLDFLEQLDKCQDYKHFLSFLEEALKEEDTGAIRVADFKGEHELLVELQSKNPRRHELKITPRSKPIAPMPMNLEIALKCATSGIVDGVLESNGEKVQARVFSKVIRKKTSIETKTGQVETREEVFMLESFAAWDQSGKLIYAKAV